MAGWLAGAAGAAVALGFGELIEGISDTIPSLVIAVGEVVTDYTPGEIVAFSIANLGASQKTMLTVGIVVLSLAICGLFGRLATRGRGVAAVAGFGVFGLIGGWAAARNPLSPALASWLVALAAAVLGAATTRFLVSRASAVRRDAEAARDADAQEEVIDDGPRQRVGTRRSFFAYAAGAGVAALSLVGIGRGLRGESAAEKAREIYTLPPRTPDPAAGATAADTNVAIEVPEGIKIEVPEGIAIEEEVVIEVPEGIEIPEETANEVPAEQAGSSTQPAPTTTQQTAEQPAPTTTQQTAEQPAPTTTQQTAEQPAPTTTQPPEQPAPTTTQQTAEQPAPTTTQQTAEQPAPTTTQQTAEQPAPTTTQQTAEQPAPTTTQPPEQPAPTTTQPPEQPAPTTTQPPEQPAPTTTQQTAEQPAPTTTQPPEQPAPTTTQPPEQPAPTTTQPPEQPAPTTTQPPKHLSVQEQVARIDTLDDEVPGLSRYITPITPQDEFYRVDTALSVPQVDPASWRLRITGMVDNPYVLTYQDIRAMRLSDYVITLSCVSNPVGGNLVGNAVWTGVPLNVLLQHAGVQRGAQQIVGRSVDDFTAGFPTTAAYDGRNAILAIGMNDEPLPTRHGFPARIVVAGLYGYVSAVKWLKEIRLTTWDSFDGYWVPRGWSKRGPIKTQSRIDVPRSNGDLKIGQTTSVAGIAWAPTRGIRRVEIKIGREDWAPCRLGQALGDESWVQWHREWTPTTPGNYQIQVRATDGTGTTQGGYSVSAFPNGAEGYHTIRTRVRR